MRSTKGQSVVEFAIVMPLFLLLFFGIFYAGMIFADYMTLSNVARSSARDASMITSDADYDNGKYSKILIKYSKVKLPVDVFSWNASDPTNFKIEYIKYDDKKGNVKVIINAPWNTEGSSIAHTFYKLMDYTGADYSLNITYTMYSEYNPKK